MNTFSSKLTFIAMIFCCVVGFGTVGCKQGAKVVYQKARPMIAEYGQKGAEKLGALGKKELPYVAHKAGEIVTNESVNAAYDVILQVPVTDMAKGAYTGVSEAFLNNYCKQAKNWDAPACRNRRLSNTPILSGVAKRLSTQDSSLTSRLVIKDNWLKGDCREAKNRNSILCGNPIVPQPVSTGKIQYTPTPTFRATGVRFNQ